jgi:hypothetical protein
MNIVMLTLIAALCNVGTIACIRKCKHAVAGDEPAAVWILGIVVTILATQFLLLRADIKGASLGLAVSFVIASVMIAAAFMGIDESTGCLVFISPRGMPFLETAGYLLAVAGVLLVGVSQQMHAGGSASEASGVAVSE